MNAATNHSKSQREDRYQGHDYYGVDELLTEEHLLARAAVRDWVKQEVSPIIESYADKSECPTHLPGTCRNWCFWSQPTN